METPFICSFTPPSKLSQLIGYRGKLQYTAFYYNHFSAGLLWTDGLSAGFADNATALDIVLEHPTTAVMFQGMQLGLYGIPATVCLCLDNKRNKVFLLPFHDALGFLSRVTGLYPLTHADIVQVATCVGRLDKLKQHHRTLADLEASANEIVSKNADLLIYLSQRTARCVGGHQEVGHGA